MGLQERIKKIQEFENNLENKKIEATKKRNKQIDDVKRKIHLNLIKKLSDEIFKRKVSDTELKLKVTKEVQGLFSDDDTPLGAIERKQIIEDLINDVVGYGPVTEFLDDKEVTEIMINNPHKLYH